MVYHDGLPIQLVLTICILILLKLMQTFCVTKLTVIASHLCWSLLESYRPHYNYLSFPLLGANNNTVTFLIHLCMFSHQIFSFNANVQIT